MDYFPDRMTVDPDTDCKGPRPIFVVGLPRSGTTLAEAVLGAHPDVTALGERAAAGILLFPMIEANAPFDQKARENFVRRDREMLPNLRDGSRAYVDKMPENYRLIGFLKSAYPGCRIINIRRDPRDIALSMWKVHFSGAALSYSNDLVQMADHFNRYVRMMDHWHRVLPGQVLDIAYEDLVGDITKVSRSMADFCALAWHPDMAQPHKSAGPTLTATASQLRQPVHHRSVGGWIAHQNMLAPFVNRLDPDLWPELT